MTPAERTLLETARTAVLATIGPDGRPRLVPICFVVSPGGRIHTPLDEKPKAGPDPKALARVRDIERRPEVGLLVERWDEDWTRLAWVRCEGGARIVEPSDPEHGPAVEALRAKYRQYADHDLEARPMIGIAIERVVSWSAVSDPGTRPGPSAEGSASSSSPGDSRPR